MSQTNSSIALQCSAEIKPSDWMSIVTQRFILCFVKISLCHQVLPGTPNWKLQKIEILWLAKMIQLLFCCSKAPPILLHTFCKISPCRYTHPPTYPHAKAYTMYTSLTLSHDSLHVYPSLSHSYTNAHLPIQTWKLKCISSILPPTHIYTKA